MQKSTFCGLILTSLIMFSSSFLELHSQGLINFKLKKSLDSLMTLDQKYRKKLLELATPSIRDSVAKAENMSVDEANYLYWNLQGKLDSLNLIFIDHLLEKTGYPGLSTVGVKTAEVAWNIIQHSSDVHGYLAIIKRAAKKRELSFTLYATMLDRYLMDNNKKQIFGTQIVLRKHKSGKNPELFIWPITRSKGINARRRKAGFKTTIEDYARKMGVIYTLVKQEDLVNEAR